MRLKAAATALQALQVQDGSVPDTADHGAAAMACQHHLRPSVESLAPAFPHDARYLELLVTDFEPVGRGRLRRAGFPRLAAGLPAAATPHQTGCSTWWCSPCTRRTAARSRLVEAVLIEVIWPEFIAARLEAGDYSNKLFVPIRFLDFTPGYDTNSAVLFPETVAVRRTPTFTWGAIFADREAARFRRVLGAAADITPWSCLPTPPNSWRTRNSRSRPS